MPSMRVFIILIGVLALTGCATQAKFTTDTLDRSGAPSGEHRILLMPIDVELSVIQASGLLEPRADWTSQARTHLTAAIRTSLTAIEGRLIQLDQIDPNYADDDKQVQLIKLNEAVGRSIMVHQYNSPPSVLLPTKKDSFEWTLGSDVRYLRDKYDADYALNVFIRDTYSSGGRVALIIFGALLGVNIPGGAQIGFANLVDLDTGEVVWFNRLLRPEGDLRTEEAAKVSTGLLMVSFPQ